MTQDLALVLNAGSSNLKFGLYGLEAEDAPAEILRGMLESRDGRTTVHARARNGAAVPADAWEGEAPESPGLYLLEWVARRFPAGRVTAVGHRVVHGGPRFTGPVVAAPAVLKALDGLTAFAPLHQPHNLRAIHDIARAHPALLQVASFDTAFHAGQPRLSRLYALPRALYEEGIHRYGFHGLSYQYVAQALGRACGGALSGRTVIAHLGSGASLCGLKDGVSMATTMGMTALDGLPMSTRCGALDPGVVLYLLKTRGFSVESAENLLYRESGLKGVSGISSDMRTLLESTEPAAHEAVELFVRRTAREIAAIAAEIGGLDTLAFTGGIGEHQPLIRSRIALALGWLGVAPLDEEANRAADGRVPTRIDAGGNRVQSWVVATDEEAVIAAETAHLHARERRMPDASFTG